MIAEREHCRREIAEIEALIRGGHPDIDGLLMAWSDWWAELRLIEQEMSLKEKTPAATKAGRAEGTGPDATS